MAVNQAARLRREIDLLMRIAAAAAEVENAVGAYRDYLQNGNPINPHTDPDIQAINQAYDNGKQFLGIIESHALVVMDDKLNPKGNGFTSP